MWSCDDAYLRSSKTLRVVAGVLDNPIHLAQEARMDSLQKTQHLQPIQYTHTQGALLQVRKLDGATVDVGVLAKATCSANSLTLASQSIIRILAQAVLSGPQVPNSQDILHICISVQCQSLAKNLVSMSVGFSSVPTLSTSSSLFSAAFWVYKCCTSTCQASSLHPRL